MKFKAPKAKTTNITNPSHHKTNVGGPISVKKKKIKIVKVDGSPNKTRTAMMRFKNLMRYLKAK